MREPVWIDSRDALTLHARLVALFGGVDGLLDDDLLESALNRPQQIFAYVKSPEVLEMAAAYTAGIVRNHPFVDGNKRTGFLIGVRSLELNEYRFGATEENGARAMIDLASGALDEANYSAFLRAWTRQVP